MAKRTNLSLLVVKDILEWIDYDLSRIMTVASVSQRAGYSKWHFQKLFQEVTGFSIAAYIRMRRITHAEYLLSQTELSVLEIYIEMGFSSRVSFTRNFKKSYHVSPIEYRKKQRSNAKHNEDHVKTKR